MILSSFIQGHEDVNELNQILQETIQKTLRDNEFRLRLGAETTFWQDANTSLTRLMDHVPCLINLIKLCRNVVAGNQHNQQLAIQHGCLDTIEHIMIQKMTSPTDPTLILQVGTQAICNMLTNNSTAIATVWHAWLTEPERGMLWSYVLSKSDDGLIMSVLVLIINCIRGHQQRCDLFVSSKSGQDMLSAILGDMERLHDNQDSKNFELGYTVLSELFSFGHFKTLFIQVDDYSHKIPLSDHQIILLKCLDAKIHSTDEFPPCISTHELTLLSQTLAHIGTLQITNKNEDLVQPIYTGIILILEILNALFVLDQPRVKAYLVQVNAVTLMIDLLRFMETIELTTTDQPKVGFDFLKRECVRLLGTLCYKDKEIQDKIRTLGGIPLILSQLKIDDSNPYIKEYAVLAIRHLLENNTENQQFIQELEPQQVIQTKELAEMGIQPELKEGKISIRRS